jgi:hypothetical protein
MIPFRQRPDTLIPPPLNTTHPRGLLNQIELANRQFDGELNALRVRDISRQTLAKVH